MMSAIDEQFRAVREKMENLWKTAQILSGVFEEYVKNREKTKFT